jgi:hypothetical protein
MLQSTALSVNEDCVVSRCLKCGSNGRWLYPLPQAGGERDLPSPEPVEG